MGLVCESHRSTEVLTSQEMDLIRHFLVPNLNSQSPGVRQQTVSLLKKVRHLLTLSLGFENVFFLVMSACGPGAVYTNETNWILIFKGITLQGDI